MAKNKKDKPDRSLGDPNHQPIPFTRAHSARVKATTHQLRVQGRKEARQERFDSGSQGEGDGRSKETSSAQARFRDVQPADRGFESQNRPQGFLYPRFFFPI